MRRGYTLTEILIAFGVMSLLFMGVFSLYRSATNSFRDGEWRISTQKTAQLLMNALREDLEKANTPYRVRSDGTITPFNVIPVYVKNEALNTAMTGTNQLAGNPNPSVRQAIAFFAVSTPAVEASPFVPTATPGQWIGCGLALVGRTLVYRRSGDPAVHSSDPVALPGVVMTFPTGGVGPGNTFVSLTGRDLRLTLDDVESVAFYNLNTATEQTLEIRLNLGRPQGTRVVGQFTERTLAKLLGVTTVTGF